MRISTAGIVRKHNKVLVALRKPGTSIGESWEFPGGKARDYETPEEGLTREFFEELGVAVTVGSQLFEGFFRNKDKEYKLLAFTVHLSDENFSLKEHSRVSWVEPADLGGYPMASSDRQILEFLLKESAV